MSTAACDVKRCLRLLLFYGATLSSLARRAPSHMALSPDVIPTSSLTQAYTQPTGTLNSCPEA